MSSTFGSFSTVRLGIYAAQKGLDVTGNNITNINTNGYTRQRLDQVSLVSSVSDRYYSSYNTRIGQGVVVNGVSQLRDPGLDISYRRAQSDVGAANGKLEGLNDLAGILDEVGKGDGEQDDGVILNQLNDLRDLISQAVTNGIEEYNSLIRASAKSLTDLFNQYAKDLNELVGKYETKLKDQVDTVNTILAGIRELNVSIRSADIRGDEALELRDQRNLLLDQLSQYVKIDVSYSMDPAGADLEVETLHIKLAGSNTELLSGEYAAELTNGGAPGYEMSLSELKNAEGRVMKGSTKQPLLDTALYGSLQSVREMLTEEGEYASAADIAGDKNAATKRGIPYYQHALDALAREFAEAMNALNQGTVDGAGNLFSNSSSGDDAANITAANISISKSWANDTVSMLATTDPSAPSGDTSNLAKFLDVFGQAHDFLPRDIVADADSIDPYSGTFEDMLLRIESTLAEDQMTTTAVLTNYATTADEIYMDRDGVMGVDLNDEATSLMTYQKAYTAACRLLTVLEEALDSLINGTV